MKRVLIKKGTVGLVFKRGEFVRLIDAGKHWLRSNETIRIYNLFELFDAPIELDILLENTELAKRLIVLEVRDHEIALHYQKGFLKGILRTGIYAYWKDEIDFAFDVIDLTSTAVITDMNVNVLNWTAILAYLRVFVIEPFEKGILFVNGEFEQVLGPGTYRFWKNAVPITLSKIDIRVQQIEVSGQEILTKDKAALRVNFHASYQVTDIKVAIMDNRNYVDQLYTQLQLALREFIGTLTLDELLEKKDEVGNYVMAYFKDKTKALGIELISAGIRDVILPGEIKEIMNQVLVAQKKAQANIITRREETASTRSLLNTAKLMEDNSMLFKLKEMEYIEKIAEKIGEITVNGNGNAVEQLKEIFTPLKK